MSQDKNENFLPQESQNDFSYSPNVGRYIKEVMKNRNAEISIPQIAELTGIAKYYLYQIIPAKDMPPKNTRNNPTRNMVIAVALALKFSLNETQQLLEYAGEEKLQPVSNFDKTIIYALERGMSIVKTNILLDEKNCELLIFEK